jgi:cytochrome c biogenesis protein CcdA
VGLWANSFITFLDNPLFLFLAGVLVAIVGFARILKPNKSCPTPLALNSKGAFWVKVAAWPVVGALVLGLICSFGWTSCSAPLIAAILGLSVGRTGLERPAILLTLYGLGVTWPFFLLSLVGHGLSRKFAGWARYRPRFTKLGGIALVSLGGWLIWDNYKAL